MGNIIMLCRGHERATSGEGIQMEHILLCGRLTDVERPYGSRLAISGLRVFGLGGGAKPEPV